MSEKTNSYEGDIGVFVTDKGRTKKTVRPLKYNVIYQNLVILLLLTLRFYVAHLNNYRISVSTLLVAIPFLRNNDCRAVKSSDVNSG